MSKTVLVSSASHFNQLLGSTKILVTDFYADWCGPCKAIAPIYEQLSAQLSRPQKVTFVKVDTERQKEVAQKYNVASLPTFMIFKDQHVVSTVQGADPRKLSELVKKIAAEADSDGLGGFGEASDSGTGWLGMGLPKGYDNVTDQVDVRGLDLLNADSNFGGARTLFDASKPSALQGGKGKGSAQAGEETKDWAESDTDEQLMLFIPFQSTLKVHSLHITSLPSKDIGAEADEVPMRPKTIQLYSNRAHVLGFEEADDVEPTQAITLQQEDWDTTTGTVKVDLRYVKFQNVSSLVLFVVDGEGDGERVRIDRLRVVGEKGSKRELGKLEKIGDETGE
ncbi:Thioredoxin-like protein 1 [Xanthoria parietina]